MIEYKNQEGYSDPTPFEALKNIEERNITMNVKRGDIFFILKGPHAAVGSETESGRPGIVVSNNKCNDSSDVVEIVFCTTKQKTALPTHVEITETPRCSIALCEQVQSVDKSRLGDYIGTLCDENIEKIDIALVESLGLNSKPSVKDNTVDENYLKMQTQMLMYKEWYEKLLDKMIGVTNGN